jgi:2-keto-myo-inositol isomerase
MALSRRHLLLAAPAGLTAGTIVGGRPSRTHAADDASQVSPPQWSKTIKYCLNTSTVRGHQLSVPEQIDLCAAAGYDAIEPWIGDIKKYVEGGGSVSDLRKRLADNNLRVPSAIGFANWIVDDPAARAKGLDEARRDMELIAGIGGTRIAAPPIGAHQSDGPALPVIAQRYRKLLEIGAEIGVVPQLELWGFSKTLSRLGELAYVAAEAGHPDACVLPDVYHIYKGGSSFDGLGMIEAQRMHVFHMNDYPDKPERAAIGDRDRVYPGDGVAPLQQILGLLKQHGFAGTLSLELFNESYWAQPAAQVAKTGIEKMRQCVAAID